MNLIYKIAHNNDDFKINDSFRITICGIELPAGFGWTNRISMVYNKVLQNSLVEIENNDRLCLPRAIVVGKAFIEKKRCTEGEEGRKLSVKYDQIRRSERAPQFEKAVELVRMASS